MQYSALLLIALATATVTANLQPLSLKASERAIETRQDDGSGDGSDDSGDGSDDSGDGSEDSDTCDSEWAALGGPEPTPSDNLANLPADDDGCYIVPASLTSDWNAYTNSLDSWASTVSEDLSTFTETCTDSTYYIAGTVCADVEAADVTTTPSAVTTKPVSATHKPTLSSPTTSTSTISTTAKKAAATGIRDTGIVGAVLAGALGAAIVL